MTPHARRHMYRKRTINQISALVIQTFLRFHHFRRRQNKKVLKVRELTKGESARKIQLAFRAWCSRRVFTYYKDLIKKLKGAPADLLRGIIPREADLLDKAAGVHVRFRLGGAIFPPKVLFKIYTHRPLCDVNSFAPRDYNNEKFKDPIETMNKSEAQFHGKSGNIRVGTRYFDTVVTTSTGVDAWYKRDEKNPWRPISSELITDIFVPPWMKDAVVSKKPAPFHYSRLKRKEDILKDKKRRKREWLVKAYMFANPQGAHVAQFDEQEPYVAQFNEENVGVSTSPTYHAPKKLLETSKSQPLFGSTAKSLHGAGEGDIAIPTKGGLKDTDDELVKWRWV